MSFDLQNTHPHTTDHRRVPSGSTPRPATATTSVWWGMSRTKPATQKAQDSALELLCPQVEQFKLVA
jgi:hypothetical protein